MPEISKEQLEEWAQVVYENCGEGEDFSVSLYDVVMEMRDASGYYKRPTPRAVDVATPCANCTQPESNHPNRMCDVFCPPRN